MTTAAATVHQCPVIVTRYLPPTDTRGSRIKATAAGGATVTVAWDHGEDTAANHARAAVELITKRFGHPADTLTLRGGAANAGGDHYAWTYSRAGVFA